MKARAKFSSEARMGRDCMPRGLWSRNPKPTGVMAAPGTLAGSELEWVPFRYLSAWPYMPVLAIIPLVPMRADLPARMKRT